MIIRFLSSGVILPVNVMPRDVTVINVHFTDIILIGKPVGQSVSH